MARRRRRRSRSSINWGFVILCALMLSAAALITLSTILEDGPVLGMPTWQQVFDAMGLEAPATPGAPPAWLDEGEVTGDCRVHVLDVGQADCILLQVEDSTVLIDGGLAETADEVIAYLQSLGISRLDLVVATHMHADHIGGLPQILPQFQVAEVLMTDLPDDQVPTTAVFERFLDAVEQSGATTTFAQPGQTWQLGEQGTLQVLGPVEGARYDDLNDTSVVCKLTSGERSFLFTGDSGEAPERDLLDAGADLAADVLDIGHHGSSTSTSEAFLSAVAPSVATISCGLDNSYGHPHAETLERLVAHGVQVWRTDLYGTIVLTTDGQTIGVQTEQQPPEELAA